jgi:hypothetical protein
MAGLLLCKVTSASRPWFLPSNRRRSCLHPLTGLDEVYADARFSRCPADRRQGHAAPPRADHAQRSASLCGRDAAPTLREIKERLDGATTEEDAIEAIGSLRELLALEDLTEPQQGSE